MRRLTNLQNNPLRETSYPQRIPKKQRITKKRAQYGLQAGIPEGRNSLCLSYISMFRAVLQFFV